MSTRRRWLTRANGLTLCRLLCAPACALAILRDAPGAAALLFWLAVTSDFADGWVARRFGEASALGRVVDHAVDAAFVSVASAALAAGGALPAPLPFLIALAFLQYALDSGFLARRGLRTSALGRANGIGYYVAVGIPITRDALGVAWPAPAVVSGLGWLLVLTTAASMIERLSMILRERVSGADSR